MTVYATSALLNWLQNYLMAGASERTVRDLRADLFEKLQHLELRFFDQHAHGDLMSRLTNDVENVNQVLSSGVTSIVSGLFGMVGIACVMFLVNAPLALRQPGDHLPADLYHQPLDGEAHAPGL